MNDVRIWTFGADVDTDQIVPGRYAPYMRPNDDVGQAAFIEAHPEYNQQASPGDIIVATNNFGCGSSREYAPLALKRRQVGAIIANSFARIFYRNSVNLGIRVYVAPDLVALLHDGARVRPEYENGLLQFGERQLKLPQLPEFARLIIDSGGIVPYVREFGHFPGTT